MNGEIHIVDEAETLRGVKIAEDFLAAIMANEPGIAGQIPAFEAMALNSSAGALLAMANAGRFPNDPMAQQGAVVGLVSGLAQSFYQILGDRTGPFLAELARQGIADGLERCATIYSAKGSA